MRWVRMGVSLAVALGAAAFFYYARNWVLQLAVFTGLALGVLTYMVFERVERLRHLYRQR